MKKFKTKTRKKKKPELYIIIIVLLTIGIINYYNKNISDKIINIASVKLEQVSLYYIKKDIAPTNVNLNDLFNVNLNSKEEITFIDIDTDYARELMVEIVEKIQENIYALERGNVSDDMNLKELKTKDGNIYLLIPLMLSSDGVLTQSIGPKVPVKLSFYEYVFGNIDIEVVEYGINNALVKIYLTISLEQKIILPYKEEKYMRDLSIIIGSKIITGKVPSIYGDSMQKSSPILEI